MDALLAAGWGAIAPSSLVLGALISLTRPVARRPLGLVMAFGAGVLISSVASWRSAPRCWPTPAA